MHEPDFSILSKLRRYPKTHKSTKNLIGRKFGHLTPFGHAGSSDGAFWLCRCDCGTFVVVRANSLVMSHSTTCGCHLDAKYSSHRKTHGRSKTRAYRIWSGMYTRCFNSKSENFRDWGARGVTLCDRWRQFENFLADMGEPPTSKHQIDRIDVNGNYEPSNCRWATQTEQQRNTRRNRYLTAHGETYCVSQWAEITGINQLLIARRSRRGWSDEEALGFKERPTS